MTQMPCTSDSATIAPGVYPLYRAGAAPGGPRVLVDQPSGLQITCAEGAAFPAPDGPYVAMITAGTVAVDGLGALAHGTAAVVPAGRAITGETPDAAWVTIACRDAAGPGAAMALRPQAHTDWPACPPPSAEVLLSPAPVQTDLTLYADDRRSFGAGFWSSTGFRRRTIPFPKFEVIYVLEGGLQVVYEDATSESFGPGDTFLIAKGARFEWRTEGLRKIWCSFAP